MYIMILGPPGSGKGSLGARLACQEDIAYISPGDIMREQVLKNTLLGREVKGYLENTRLLPVDILVRVLKEHLKHPTIQKGFIGDALARTLPQALALDKILLEMGFHLDSVIYIKVSDTEAIKRMIGRRICPTCGEIYHINFIPPKQYGICNKDGSSLFQRDDDTLPTAIQRLKIYNDNIEFVINHYRDKGLLRVINGMQTPNQVLFEIKSTLQ